MTIEEMRTRKRELGYTNAIIAEKTGLPLSTVQKVFSGATKAPRRETIKALEALLAPDGRRKEGRDRNPDGFLRERNSDYGMRGGYTLEDYLALPDDRRVELIDGVFYDMAAPTTTHQALAGYLYKIFLDHVLEKQGPCFPFISPVDVQLDADDRTVVQPDVIVICDPKKNKNGRMFGAPDLIVEVLSPSSRRMDMIRKLDKYEAAGVREYWIVDPEQKRVIRYDMKDLKVPELYTFQDTIPVLIWDGDCRVDLSVMEKALRFLWEEE